MPKTGYQETETNAIQPSGTARLLPEEREVVLIMNDRERKWEASCSSPTYMRKFEKQGWKCTGENYYKDGTVCTRFYEAPSKSSISIGKYERPKKVMSEEHKKKLIAARRESLANK